MELWKCALELDAARILISGSAQDLVSAIGRAADLRIYTEFLHNEHIDVESASSELIREVAEFGVTYLVDRNWAAGIMNLRQPIALPGGFGPRPSMSFFMYNQDGTQAIARPYLDGGPIELAFGPSPIVSPAKMRKYHVLDSWDDGTNAPCQNFIYDFERFRYCVNDSWREVFAHSADGTVTYGSLDQLVDSFKSGCAIKIGVGNICLGMGDDPNCIPDHELYVHGGSAYYYTEQKLFIIGSHPLVRVSPSVPMRFTSRNWDFGWLMLRSDGRVVYRRCNPYTLKFDDQVTQNAIRWFVR